jgi:hypothetical protein
MPVAFISFLTFVHSSSSSRVVQLPQLTSVPDNVLMTTGAPIPRRYGDVIEALHDGVVQRTDKQGLIDAVQEQLDVGVNGAPADPWRVVSFRDDHCWRQGWTSCTSGYLLQLQEKIGEVYVDAVEIRAWDGIPDAVEFRFLIGVET